MKNFFGFLNKFVRISLSLGHENNKCLHVCYICTGDSGGGSTVVPVVCSSIKLGPRDIGREGPLR